MGFDAMGAVVLWSAVTLGCYLVSRAIYRRWPNWWLMPLAITPLFVGVVLVAFGVPYARYIAGTRWLVWMLGPATVAFAIPIYDQRALALRHWRVLALGMVAGSVTAIGSSWVLASLVGINGVLRLSLLPRSISTPFAMDLSAAIGGVPELTAVFVIATGVMGAVMGEIALARMPAGSTLAGGTMFGVGAHAAGTAHAQRLDPTVAALSGMTMVLTGVLNVVLSPLIRLVVG
jgi:predicted murein hydrolase (TIGR00659 family)